MDLRRHLTFANIASATALVVAVTGVGGLAVADGTADRLAKNSVKSKQIKDGAIKAADLKDGAVTGAKVADGGLSGADVDEATLSQVPSAARAADSGDVLRAVVRADATLAAGQSEHVVGVTATGGVFTVTFDREVVGCTYVVSPGPAGVDTPFSGHASAARSGSSTSAVVVWTMNANTNALQAFPFHLIVAC